MRAIGYKSFGAASDVLETVELPDPVAGHGEVVVDLVYSGVNPSDVKSRAGRKGGPSVPEHDFVIPHSDGAGVISAVGEGVDPSRLGERVWIWNGQWKRAYGTMAQKIALPSAQAVYLPDHISFEQGAALGIPGLTAAHCVMGGGDLAGKSVLVCGGAGAVGHIAVQLAKWADAHVVATASEKNRDKVKAAGADHVLEYMSPSLSNDILSRYPQGIDRAVELEFGVNVDLLAEVMRPMGTIAAYGSALDLTPTLPFFQYLFKALTIDITLVYLLDIEARQAAIDVLHQASQEGALTIAIDKIYEFEDCAQAHEDIQNGGRTGVSLIKI